MESYSSESLQQRLAAGLGNKGGARGSLTRCAGRLGSLKRALDEEEEEEDKSSNSNNNNNQENDTNEAAKASNEAAATATAAAGNNEATAAGLLSRELQLAHIEMTKLFLLARRQEVELEQLRDCSLKILTEKIATERATVDLLRQGLQQASSTVACQREYESLAKLASSRHPTARRVLQEQMDQVQAQLEQTHQDFKMATAHVEIRERQFQLLIQCMLDLKQSLSEPLDHLDMDDDNGRRRATATGSGGTDPDTTTMEGVEKTSGGDDNDDDDEEGALYDDL